MTLHKSGNAFSIGGRLQSFRFAALGLAFMFRTQHNAWIHLAITGAVVAAGWRLQVSAADWRWLVAAIVLVWFAETMNTAFEYVCDVVSPEFHGSVEKAKDIAAGAVLVCAVGAILLGGLTLWPYLAR
ncbi:MAG: diacylglycerol kinase family protein [Pseudomonadota bacterium]